MADLRTRYAYTDEVLQLFQTCACGRCFDGRSPCDGLQRFSYRELIARPLQEPSGECLKPHPARRSTLFRSYEHWSYAEGLKAIRAIKDDAALSALVTRCDPHAQSAFAKLCECLPTGKHHAEFQRYIQLVRNRIAFHYTTAEINEALEFRTKHHSDSLCATTIGEDIHSCRFDFADVVIDTIVCRKLWAIPIAADVRAEADRIGDWCRTKSIEFLTFGGDFVTRFLQEHA